MLRTETVREKEAYIEQRKRCKKVKVKTRRYNENRGIRETKNLKVSKPVYFRNDEGEVSGR